MLSDFEFIVLVSASTDNDYAQDNFDSELVLDRAITSEVDAVLAIKNGDQTSYLNNVVSLFCTLACDNLRTIDKAASHAQMAIDNYRNVLDTWPMKSLAHR